MQLTQQKVLVPNIFQYGALQELEKVELTKNKGVVVMPTGTGKTFLAALWFRKKLDQDSNAKLLFICHNNDILSQANEKEFQTNLKDMEISYSYYNANEKKISQATFGTVQTLSNNLFKIKDNEFDYIIIDEVHHYQAKSFKKVVQYFKPRFLLGLTATPYRMDGKCIFEICGNQVYNGKISEAIKKDLLTKINYYCVDNDLDFSNMFWNGINYREKDLNRKMCVEEYDNAIIKEYQDNIITKFKKKKTICFCATVKHCYRMEKLFKSKGFKAVALTGNKADGGGIWRSTREKVVEGFKKGDYDIIFVRDLFNEGVDIPDADSIMMLRPTQSHTIFTQQIGRGLRKAEGKDDVLILDFTGNAKRCIINFEVLTDMLGEDLIEKIKRSSECLKDASELVIVSNGCRVRLNRTKLDLIRFGEGKYRFTNQQLKEAFFELKDKVGRVPLATDMDKCGKHHHSIYTKRYNTTWDKIVKMYGFEARIKHTSKEEVIKKYNELKDKLKRVPKKGDFPMSTQTGINNYFKQYNNLLKFMNDHNPSPQTKDELISEYFSLKAWFGKVNVRDTINSGLTHKKVFGGWTKFLEELDEPITLNRTKVTKSMLIEQYYNLKRKLGRQPTQKDMSLKSNVKYTLKKYHNLFGLWTDFLKELGEPLNQNNVFTKDVTKEDLINNYYDVKKKLEREITSEDIKCKGISKYGIMKYISKYGSWCNFLDKIGEKNRKLNIDKNRVREDIIRVKSKIGHIPNYLEYIKEGNYSIPTTKKIAPTFGKVIEELFGYKKEIKYKICKCLTCGKEVKSYYDRKYCSKNCFELDNIIELKCQCCKKLFIRSKNDKKLSKSKFCSVECYHNNRSSNIMITDNYKPKVELPKHEIKKKGNSSVRYNWKASQFETKDEKINIREKIIEKIEDGDKVLLLESPELSALKEIEKQGKKPSKILIPNNLEFKKLAESLRNYKTNLNIELINTSVLQYLVDSNERFDFLWLDYCGAFSYYIKDLDILFTKMSNNIKLILTYNLFDPAKDDDSYYFTKVIDYVLGKAPDNSKVRLINNISYRYKKQMYNIGFDIQQKLEV